MTATDSGVSFDSITSKEAVKAGVISMSMGGSAMIARQLLSTDKPTWGYLLRSTFAACITAFFTNYACKDYVQSESLRVCCCGVAGFASPEILNYLLAYIKAKGQAKVDEAQSALRKSKTKTKGQTKSRKRHGR